MPNLSGIPSNRSLVGTPWKINGWDHPNTRTSLIGLVLPPSKSDWSTSLSMTCSHEFARVLRPGRVQADGRRKSPYKDAWTLGRGSTARKPKAQGPDRAPSCRKSLLPLLESQRWKGERESELRDSRYGWLLESTWLPGRSSNCFLR